MISDMFNSMCHDLQTTVIVEKQGVAAYPEHWERNAVIDLARKVTKIVNHYLTRVDGKLEVTNGTGTAKNIPQQAKKYAKEIVEREDEA